MANLIRFFMVPEDEVAFFRYLERHHLEVYPQRIPPEWEPFRAAAKVADRIPAAAYLAASELAPVIVDRVKRGPDKGHWLVDDQRSSVLYFERCTTNEHAELVSGRLWAELDVTPQSGRKDAAPDRFRRLFQEIEAWMKATYRKSDPKGFWVGPKAARAHKSGLVLRDSEHRGGTVKPYG